MPPIEPYRIEVPESSLDDLRERLARTRWPEAETVDDWSQGVPLAYLQELCAYWRDGYDWRRAERALGAVPGFTTAVDGVSVHFLHARSPEPGALPLVLTHGWPGSVVEFLDVIGPLSDPVAHGGSAADAFHVVCPSLPGYGFSGRPASPGWTLERIADAWAQLMTRLGYDRFGAQGGDWGAGVAAELGVRHPERLAGVHVNLVFVDARAMGELAADGDLTRLERSALERIASYRRSGSGYARIQSTRPQTIGYGLVDSPAAQCAWIVEKFAEWTDGSGHPEDVLSRDQLLDNVMLYWLPGAGASSGRLYWESFRRRAVQPVRVPAGFSRFPGEILPASRRLVETRLADLRYYGEPDRGGHFAAFEQPDRFVQEVRAFFRLVR